MASALTLARVTYGDFGWSVAALVDLNADGFVDIIASRLYWPPVDRGRPVEILIGDGAGGFTPSTNAILGTTPTPVHPREIVVSDFNADGRPDLFIADHGYDANPFPGNANWLLLSEPGGKMRGSSIDAPPDFTHSATAGDYDGDGDNDIFVGNIWGAGRIGPYFLKNDGAGRFTRAADGLPAEIADIQTLFTTSALGDLDRDGDLDLVLGSYTAETYLLKNDGAGRYAVFQKISGPFGRTNTISLDSHILDMNGDGAMDVVLVSTQADPSYIGSATQFLLQGSDGRFTPQAPFSARTQGAWDIWVKPTDLDFDGDLDLLYAPSWPGLGQVYMQTPSGFSSAAISDAWANYAFGDVDANGTTDAIAFDGGSLKVYLNTQPAPIVRAEDGAHFFATTGDDAIKGGAGTDTFHVQGRRADYLVESAGACISLSGPADFDSLYGVERIAFLDGTLLFDFQKPADALVYRLYQAAFARTPDEGGFIFWANATRTAGLGALDLAKAFRAADEFTVRYGRDLPDQQYVAKIYENALGRAPDQPGLDYWTELLRKQILNRDQVLVEFAGSPENIGLTAPNMATGFWVV